VPFLCLVNGSKAVVFTNLKILLYRPWEGPEKAVDSLQVKIRIR
jgi:hypothetical protein